MYSGLDLLVFKKVKQYNDQEDYTKLIVTSRDIDRDKSLGTLRITE